MAGEHGFEDGSAAGTPIPGADGPGPCMEEPEDWEYVGRDCDASSPEELGLVDPMSPEEFAYLGSPDVRWVELPRFDPALFEPLPGTTTAGGCCCGRGCAPREPEPDADKSDPAGLPSPEAAMAQIRLERAAEVLDALEALEAEQARRDADRAVLLAALTRAEGGDAPVAMLDAPAVAASETAAVLRVAQRTARAMVEEALALTHPAMAPVLSAMTAGRLTRRRAAIVLDAAIPVPASQLEDFAAAATAVAAPEDRDRTPTPGALGRRLRRLAEDYADEPLAQRKAKAMADRRVDIDPCGDGMCHLTALIPLETGALIDTRLNAIARGLQAPDEARTLNQLRADILTDLLTASGLMSAAATGPTHAPAADGMAAPGAAAESGTPMGEALPAGPAGGVRMDIVVTVPAATLEGKSETPGEILGYGPIDPGAARLLASEAATWTRLSVHPLTGAPLAIGRVRYRPTAAMRRFLALRDATCTFPGCDKPAAACEADHTQEWANDGDTDVGNLALLCREHHRLKTLGYWKVRHIGRQGPSQPAPRTAEADTPAAPAGTLEWTAPSGRKHITYPHTDPPPPF